MEQNVVLKKIEKIRDFGVFRDVPQGNQPNSMPEFSKMNLFYGENYSGKTTLSRAFACLERNEAHADYANALVRFEDTSGRLHSTGTSASIKVRVYNEDFRKANLQWDEEDGIEPILVFGQANIAAQEALTQERITLGRLQSEYRGIEETINNIESTIEKALTATAKTISRTLAINPYNKSKLRRVISGWPGRTIPNLLKAEQVSEAEATVRGRVMPALPILSFACAPIDNLWTQVEDALALSLVSRATISVLTENPEKNRWVAAGMALHKEETHCSFCENEIAPERIAALEAHFSRAYDEQIKLIENLVGELRSRMIEIDSAPYREIAFYEDIHAEHKDVVGKIKPRRKAFDDALKTMITKLEEKRSDPFKTIVADLVAPDVEALVSAFDELGDLVRRHNERTANFTAEVKTAKDLLIQHYAASDMLDLNLRKLEFQLSWGKALLSYIKGNIDRSQTEIGRLSQVLSNARNAADRINITLQQFFGKDDIRIEPTVDDRFRLIRGSDPAKNLSEGERTAIAFCYFIASLFDDQSGIADTIVYIDDPISSLDANHLYHMNSFIRETFYEKRPGQNPAHVCRAQQFFISTHNLEFFHLLYGWNRDGAQWKTFRQSFMIQRLDAPGGAYSQIVECPKAIRSNRSLYLLSFKQMRKFIDNPADNEELFFNIGNVARKFLEAYLSARYLENEAIDGSLDELLPGSVDRERVRKFVHSKSHVFTSGGGLTLPDMGEATSVLSLILDALRLRDPEHYEALERASQSS